MAAVLSTIKGIESFLAILATLGKFVTWPPGLEILSQKIAFVFESAALFIALKSCYACVL